MLLRLINDHYHSAERERRGIVESMRLMADEARALAHEAREQSSEHLQVILDHIKDVVLALDEDGVIRTFNPTGERVFGYSRTRSSASASICCCRSSPAARRSPRRCSASPRAPATPDSI